MGAEGTNLLSGVNVEVTAIKTLTSAPSLDASNNQIKASLAAIDVSNNQIKVSAMAMDASLNTIKGYLAVLDSSINYGRNVKPTWIHADISSNAGAGSTLVSQAVSSGKQGYIYGWEIASEDTSNNFQVNWTSGGATKRLLVIFAGNGNAMNQYQGAALNEGLPADQNTTVTITNTVAAQTAKRLQARLLYGEV